jgi:hypothetical protein
MTNHTLLGSLALATLALALTGPLSAQDDLPWWKAIFSKSNSTGNADSTPTAEPNVSTGPASPDRPSDIEGSLSDGQARNAAQVFDPFAAQPEVDWGGHGFTSNGTSSLQLSEAAVPLTARDTTVHETTPGFRVQIHLGRLDTARALRANLEADSTFCWLVDVSSMPPLFAVSAGQFLSPLQDHRVMRALRTRFPNALVVPADLPLAILIEKKNEGIEIR